MIRLLEYLNMTRDIPWRALESDNPDEKAWAQSYLDAAQAHRGDSAMHERIFTEEKEVAEGSRKIVSDEVLDAVRAQEGE